MKLLDFCDPVFQEVLQANSHVKAESVCHLDFSALRTRFKNVITDRNEKAEKRPEISSNYDRIRPALIYFIDEFVLQSKLKDGNKLPCYEKWVKNPLENDPLNQDKNPIVKGGTDFFTRLEQDLGQVVNEDAKERLTVYYTCLGLGFKGDFFEDPIGLQRKMGDIRTRLESWVHPGVQFPIFRGEHEPDTRNLGRKPSRWIKYAAIATVVVCISLFVGYCTLYYDAFKELKDVLDAIPSVTP